MNGVRLATLLTMIFAVACASPTNGAGGGGGGSGGGAGSMGGGTGALGGGTAGEMGGGTAGGAGDGTAGGSAADAGFVGQIIQNMTLRDKVREVLIGTITPNQPYTGTGILFGAQMAEIADGGDPEFAQSSASFGGHVIHTLRSADQEGGAVDRFKHAGYPAMPSPATLATMGTAQIQQIARDQADHAYALNIRMIYAPVLDPQTSDMGPASIYSEWVIGKSYSTYDPTIENSRRYSADPAVVQQTATTYLQAFKQRTAEIQTQIRMQTGDPNARFDVLIVGKHFPGEWHPVDSDDADIKEMATLDGLHQHAAIYLTLAQQGLVDLVMVSNNEYIASAPGPAIDNPDVVSWATAVMPTTTDDTALDRRQQAGDSIPDLAVQAFDAGNTFIMVCDDAQIRTNVENALYDHLQAHPELVPKLESNVGRVLQLKDQVGLITH
jgi:beta-glucosidase-like glycosyl hydrolase